ncbi:MULTISPECIES: hypothetical protein [Providencia]|uniref:hypothetical protein n=1 Tax=Providencia TaxID=586 RepID=UPI0012B63A1B|nr:hypothetical protein [Providencia sp. wls1914]MTC71993.1 hypothetical protein [Providencia sp. wls1914]
MEFKGTPMPWEVVTKTRIDLPSCLVKKGDKVIAHTLQRHTGAEQARANAHLIAAAPELLEALIEIRKLVAHHDKADLAIAKALGQQ